MKKLSAILVLVLSFLLISSTLVLANEEGYEDFGAYQDALNTYAQRGYKRLLKLKNPVIIEAEDFVAEGMEREPRTGSLPKVEIVTTDDAAVSGGKYVTGWV